MAFVEVKSPPPPANALSGAVADVTALARGLGVTLGYMFQKPVTIQYPEERPRISARHRGRHELERHDNGLEKCVGCELCALACPSKAIFVEGAENPPDAPVSIGERYAKTYIVNMIRCVEACPTEALQLKKVFELADYTRESMIYSKETLLAPAPKREATDSWMPG